MKLVIVVLLALSLLLTVDNSWMNVLGAVRNKVVFARHNQKYGAYQLRTEYNKRLGVSLASAIGFMIIAVGAPFVISKMGGEEEVEVKDTGVIEAFTIVHIPIPGNPIKPPFIAASILLDGTDMACLHLVSEVPTEQVHVGMRVQAVWRPREEWDYTFENIAWFKPAEGA